MFYVLQSWKRASLEAPKKSLKLFIANPTKEQYKFFGYTDEIIEDAMQLEENQDRPIEDIVMELYCNGEFDLYAESVESDFDTEEIEDVEF